MKQIVFVTVMFFVAVLLQLISSMVFQNFFGLKIRVEFIALVFFFTLISFPSYFSLPVVFFLGLLIDVLMENVLGSSVFFFGISVMIRKFLSSAFFRSEYLGKSLVLFFMMLSYSLLMAILLFFENGIASLDFLYSTLLTLLFAPLVGKLFSASRLFVSEWK